MNEVLRALGDRYGQNVKYKYSTKEDKATVTLDTESLVEVAKFIGIDIKDDLPKKEPKVSLSSYLIHGCKVKINNKLDALTQKGWTPNTENPLQASWVGSPEEVGKIQETLKKPFGNDFQCEIRYVDGKCKITLPSESLYTIGKLINLDISKDIKPASDISPEDPTRYGM